jgi:hypothetical protein
MAAPGNEILVKKKSCRLQLNFNGYKGQLVFYTPDCTLNISKDYIDYLIATLVQSIENISIKNPEHFELKEETPLGKLFNSYSFNLGHLGNTILSDLTEKYRVFGDDSCLFLYKINNKYFIEISTIYDQINNLSIEYDTFLDWQKTEFISYEISIELNDLINMRDKLMQIRSENLPGF